MKANGGIATHTISITSARPGYADDLRWGAPCGKVFVYKALPDGSKGALLRVEPPTYYKQGMSPPVARRRER